MCVSRLARVLVLVACATACDTLPVLAPNDSTIDLIVDQPTVPLNGKTVITAVVTEPARTPVQNGTVVTFAATLGTLDADEAPTSDGRASIGFTAGLVSGKATITAFSGSAISGDRFLSIGPVSP